MGWSYEKGLFLVLSLLFVTFLLVNWAQTQDDLLLSPGPGYFSLPEFILNIAPLFTGILIVGAVVFMILVGVGEQE